MATCYYYNPRAKRLYKNILHARNYVLNTEQDQNGRPLLMRSLSAEQWCNLTNDHWCRANPEKAAQYLNLFPTRTKWLPSINFHMWLCRRIQRDAVADG